MNYRNAGAAALVFCSLGMTGCGAGDQAVPLPEVTPITSTSPAVSENRVDPEIFRGPGDDYLFKHLGTNGQVRECFFDTAAATCLGVAGPDIPDISVPPFADQAPSAVSVTEAGVRYTIFEGVPPAYETLEPGQSLELGPVRCELNDASDLTCSVGDNSFAIDGDSGLISTEGVVIQD